MEYIFLKVHAKIKDFHFNPTSKAIEMQRLLNTLSILGELLPKPRSRILDKAHYFKWMKNPHLTSSNHLVEPWGTALSLNRKEIIPVTGQTGRPYYN